VAWIVPYLFRMIIGCFCGTTGTIGEVVWKLFPNKSHAAALEVDFSQALPVRVVKGDWARDHTERARCQASIVDYQFDTH